MQARISSMAGNSESSDSEKLRSERVLFMLKTLQSGEWSSKHGIAVYNMVGESEYPEIDAEFLKRYDRESVDFFLKQDLQNIPDILHNGGSVLKMQEGLSTSERFYETYKVWLKGNISVSDAVLI